MVLQGRVVRGTRVFRVVQGDSCTVAMEDLEALEDSVPPALKPPADPVDLGDQVDREGTDTVAQVDLEVRRSTLLDFR